MATETVVYTQRCRAKSANSNTHTIVGQKSLQVDESVRGKDATRAAPHNSADWAKYSLAQFQLGCRHLSVCVSSVVVASHTILTTHLRPEEPGGVPRPHIGIQIERNHTATPYGLEVVCRRFDVPQRGIAGGQFAAWYEGDRLIGSGVIKY